MAFKHNHKHLLGKSSSSRTHEYSSRPSCASCLGAGFEHPLFIPPSLPPSPFHQSMFPLSFPTPSSATADNAWFLLPRSSQQTILLRRDHWHLHFPDEPKKASTEYHREKLPSSLRWIMGTQDFTAWSSALPNLLRSISGFKASGHLQFWSHSLTQHGIIHILIGISR